MSTVLYTRLAQSALALIQGKGQELPVSKRGDDAVYDSVSGEYSSNGTPVTGTLDAVAVPRLKSFGKLEAQYQRDFILGKVRFLIVAAASATFAPDAGHTVTFEGGAWEVLGATSLSPSGTPLIYYVAIRRK